ncbi:MAG TPA: MiaB/RimO family radical SAM methylthiotransferase, partial [bacterium]|nr:MiaB/RimO family radical SAM methylthiotransferase [bacterium]
MSKYFITVIGCQMNLSDSQKIATQLNNLGWEKTDERQVADLNILVTCGVRQGAEDRIYGLIKQIKKDNPESKVALTGCLSYRQDIKSKLGDQVDYWFNITELIELEKIIPNPSLSGSLNHLDDYLKISPSRQSRVSAIIPIGNGCNNFCSYCVVPYARGREKYRPATEIINEAKELLANGYQEIKVIAQNVNSYFDTQNNWDFTDLLNELDKLGNYWLSFATSHPKDMSDKLIDFLGHSKNLVHYLHLPVQAGSNRILQAMNRNYTKEHYLELVKKIRLACPNISLTTDIIVGFPGETEKDFLETCDLVEQANFDQIYIAQFSSRPGTAAAKLIDDVTDQEKKQRE